MHLRHFAALWLVTGFTVSLAAAVREPGIELSNAQTQVVIDAAVGGRAVAYTAGGRSWLWHDAAAVPVEATVAKPWEYAQIGGFHLWPAPQSRWKRGPALGWPPPGWLDHGVYTPLASDATSVALRSPVETHIEQTASGLQAELRYALVAPTSNRLTVTSTFSNTTTQAQFWAHWHVTTVRLPPAHQGCVVFPVNANSIAGNRGFVAQTGKADEPAYERVGPLVRAWWTGHQGKIAADSMAGWLAAEDRRSGSVFVQRFSVDKSLPFGTYPEGNCPLSVCFTAVDGFTELEVMGPERELPAGGVSGMTVEWSACRVDGPLCGVTAAGVVVRPLALAAGHVSGSFGVHEQGTAVLSASGVAVWNGPCSPDTPLVIDVAVTASGPLKLMVGERLLAEMP